ncbi:F-box only protein 6-like [Cryptomeria japonica]|uniref:F-box only protein 6-like n=1 Tax=Cryptomeria japonica TaxID=3369 RepID=UPI0025ABB0E2|nr:F-box only protein 6-like [Cryptomeria japonica]XP_057821991.1 F-box only protein 6-like [Cryptomeria japonica]
MDTKCMDVIENEDEGLERSELLLNTTEEKGRDTESNERSDVESVWSEFPDHLVEEIFSNLLFEFTLPFRIVCKQWNKLLSSNIFLSSLAESDPWILLCSSTHCMAYCFLNQCWKTLSLSFLPNRTTKSFSLGNTRFCSSGAGLLLIEFGWPRKYMICNPITRTYRYNPPVISQSATLSAIMDNGESYKIAGVTHERNPGSLQIYHCSKASCQIELELPLEPRDFPVSHICCAKGLLIGGYRNTKLFVYSLQGKGWSRIRVPDSDRFRRYNTNFEFQPKPGMKI